MLRIPLRPGEAPCELIAGLVGYLQRRLGLDVVDYDLLGGQRGVVRLAAPDPGEAWHRLRLRCSQACARASETRTQSQLLRARSAVLKAERRMWMDAIRANAWQWHLAAARSPLPVQEAPRA